MDPFWRIERHAEIGSTNTAALEIARQRLAQGASAAGVVLVAERQTAGRGQHGRTWESPAGGLYLSAVVEDLPPAARDRLALVAGVAVLDALADTGAGAAAIRWPNDVLLGGRKVCGILCESLAMGQRWAGIIGIGININTDPEAWPPAVRRTATSLLAHDGRRRGVREVEGAVLRHLDVEVRRTAQEGLAGVIARVQEHDALRGRVLELDTGTGVWRGAGAGIGPRGELLVDTGQGLEAVRAGTVVSVDGLPVRGVAR